jgi:hypothetical protein
VASTPHPRPRERASLASDPATRFARGGRGASPCSLKCSIPKSLSHQTPSASVFIQAFAAGFHERAARACRTDAASPVASPPTPDLESELRSPRTPPRASRAEGGEQVPARCARGGRGVNPCLLKCSIPGSLSQPAPPASVFIQASPQALASSRTRMM